MLEIRFTREEPLHAVAVGHFQEATARVRGQSGVGSIRQQDSHHIQVVVLHGIVDRPGHTKQHRLKGDQRGLEKIEPNLVLPFLFGFPNSVFYSVASLKSVYARFGVN